MDHNPNTVEYSATGYITFWNLTEGSHDAYEQAFTNLALNKFTPKRQTPRQALLDATKELTNGSYVLGVNDKPYHVIKPRVLNERLPIYDVYIREQEDVMFATQSTPPRLTPAFTTRVDADTDTIDLKYHIQLMGITQPSSSILNHFTGLYSRARDTCTPANISKSLTSILDSFNATSLRPRGGIHWIHEKHRSKWESVADTVSKCSFHIQNQKVPHIFIITVRRDKELVLAVRDGLTHSIASALKDLVNDVGNKDLGQRATKARQVMAIDLKKKVEEYEEVLGETLEGLHQACDMAKAVAAEAVVTKLAEI